MSKLKQFEYYNSPTGIVATRRERDDMTDIEKLMSEYDHLHPDGKYVVPGGPPPRIHFRDMSKYCKERGIEPKDLTKEEMKQFRY